LEPETQHAFGRSSETTREEVKFQKFISKMRKRFSFMLIDALRAQLILKNILKKSEWNEIEEELNIDFIQDNYFSELKEFEILKERLETLNTMTEFIGKYYSNKWIRNNILKQTDDDINTIDKEIEAEPDDTDLEEIDV
jgi:chromatin segregation and condensation protein Rec8/ScpA/Scc1 (kleisin family)